MKVLHMSTADNQGGSARSAYRLHSSLREKGVDSKMLVKYRATDDENVDRIAGTPWLRALDKVAGRVEYHLGLQYLWYPSTSRLKDHAWFRSADVLQLFNTHGNFFAHTVLPTLSAIKPVVWRLSDMWPFTGHCSYSLGCERWRTGCGRCPIVKDYPPLAFDTTALLHRIKNRVYAKSRLTIVAPSRWIGALASESPLLSRFPVHYIPNGIDLNDFRPMHKGEARRSLGLPMDRRVLLFHDPGTGSERKGRDMIGDIVRHVDAAAPGAALMFFGPGGAEGLKSRANVFEMGQVGDLVRLRTIYSAADLFVFPALADNLPNVALESMACGTPVVSFDIGGLPDAVVNGVSGELVSPSTAEAMASAVARLLSSTETLASLSTKARRRVETEFARARERDAFLSLYQSLIATRTGGRV